MKKIKSLKDRSRLQSTSLTKLRKLTKRGISTLISSPSTISQTSILLRNVQNNNNLDLRSSLSIAIHFMLDLNISKTLIKRRKMLNWLFSELILSNAVIAGLLKEKLNIKYVQRVRKHITAQ